MRSSPCLSCGPKQPRPGYQPSRKVPKLNEIMRLKLRSNAMKKFLVITLMAFALFVMAPAAVVAQGGAKQGPDVVRDPDMEKDSLHNLEVARHYFKLKKAYVAALQRCEEIIAGNPNFARMDEVIYIAGESSLRLAENKGKQA